MIKKLIDKIAGMLPDNDLAKKILLPLIIGGIPVFSTLTPFILLIIWPKVIAPIIVIVALLIMSVFIGSIFLEEKGLRK